MNSDSPCSIRRAALDLGPWHMDIQITEEFATSQVAGECVPGGPADHFGDVSFISPRKTFLRRIDRIYPQGLADKRFLDCACNAGGYCFWARERDVKHAIGFDVREHWINQARFIQQHRSVAETDRVQFEVLNLYDLPGRELGLFDITMFKGIFYHLPDPIHGLKIAADRTREVIWFNSQFMGNERDGFLKLGTESRKHVMSGVHGLKWFPTGPRVIADVLRWLGFVQLKLTVHKLRADEPNQSRMEIMGSRIPGLLDNIRGESLV